MQSTTASLLLTKLNTDSNYFTLSELRDCDDDSPFDARREINTLLKEGFVREEGNRRYRITVDIYTLRKIVLNDEAINNEPTDTDKTYRLSCLDIIDSVWHVKSDYAKTDTLHSGQAENDSDEEINRRRREYLERRRRELIARLQAETDEEDDDEDNDDLFENEEDEEEDEEDDPFEDDEFSMTTHALFAKSEEEEMLEKIRKLLIDEDRNSKLAVAALKLCSSEGYVSPWLLCKTQRIDDSTAEFICFWLYVKDFIKRDDSDENKYLLAIPENLFFACCQEAEERKNSLGYLAGTLKKIGEQKQKNEQEERASLQKYVNNYQFRKVVRSKLIALVRTDLKMTRAKAITKAEGCLCAARDMGNDKAAAVYEKVIFELNNMSDYMFNRLKSQYAD